MYIRIVVSGCDTMYCGGWLTVWQELLSCSGWLWRERDVLHQRA